MDQEMSGHAAATRHVGMMCAAEQSADFKQAWTCV